MGASFTDRIPEELPPPAGLEDRILCLWSLEAGPSARLPILPDGCLDLVWMQRGSHRSLILAGLDLEATTAPVAPEVSYLGVRLRPGIRPEPLGFRAETLVGARVDLSSDGPAGLQPWVQAVLEAVDPFPLLCQGLGERLRPVDSGALEALHLAVRGADGPASRRTFQRTLTQATGLPPSTWFATGRARTAAHRLLDSDQSLADVAAEAGFADQAHLTRELKRRLGLTPGRMRCHREVYLGMLRAPSAF